MISVRYTLSSDEAKKIPRFYEPTHESQVNGLTFISRENGSENSITYNLEDYADATCNLRMNSLHNSLIREVEISGREEDFNGIKKVVEGALGMKLLHSLPSGK